jgi:hypothetical protein
LNSLDSADSPLARYRELTAKVDAFFERAMRRHADEMQCGSGCHDCCHTRFSVTGVEAQAIREGLSALEGEARARISERARAANPARCPALEDNGRCAIYAVRPLVCRSHGLPIRMPSPRGLPVIVTCFRNFCDRDRDRDGDDAGSREEGAPKRGPERASPDCVLDQTTLSVLLHAVDAEHAKKTGRAAGERVEMEALFSFEQAIEERATALD